MWGVREHCAFVGAGSSLTERSQREPGSREESLLLRVFTSHLLHIRVLLQGLQTPAVVGRETDAPGEAGRETDRRETAAPTQTQLAV